MFQKSDSNDITTRLKNDDIIIIDASYELQQFLNYYNYHVYNLAQILVTNISNAINNDNHTTKIVGIPENHNSNEWHEWHGQMLHFKNSIGDNPQFYPMPFYMLDLKFSMMCNRAWPTYTKSLNKTIQHICYYLANLTNDDTLILDDDMAYGMILNTSIIKTKDPNTKWIHTPQNCLHTFNAKYYQYNADNNTITPRSKYQVNQLQQIIKQRSQR